MCTIWNFVHNQMCTKSKLYTSVYTSRCVHYHKIVFTSRCVHCHKVHKNPTQFDFHQKPSWTLRQKPVITVKVSGDQEAKRSLIQRRERRDKLYWSDNTCTSQNRARLCRYWSVFRVVHLGATILKYNVIVLMTCISENLATSVNIPHWDNTALGLFGKI